MRYGIEKLLNQFCFSGLTMPCWLRLFLLLNLGGKKGRTEPMLCLKDMDESNLCPELAEVLKVYAGLHAFNYLASDAIVNDIDDMFMDWLDNLSETIEYTYFPATQIFYVVCLMHPERYLSLDPDGEYCKCHKNVQSWEVDILCSK